MSVGQELLLRRPLTERFAPLVSARVPLFGPITDCAGRRGRRSQVVAANLLNQTFSRTSKRRRDQRKTDEANSCFWCDLNFFRMNTCAKRVGGGGCRFSTPTLTPRGEREALADGRRAIAPPARLRYSAAQGSGENF